MTSGNWLKTCAPCNRPSCSVSLGYSRASTRRLAVWNGCVACVLRRTKVFAGVDTKFCLVRALFHRAYAYQADALRKRYPRSALYDNLVFSKAAAQVGLGNCRIIVSGAAPLPPYLCEFLKILFNCPVLQGYGMTETAAAVTISLPTCPNLGHVGPPVASSELRLRSVPEMNYNVTDEHPRGEIQMRGSNIFKGYFKNEEATEGVLNDGWMSSGDIGRLNPNGTFSIIDRKKNIFKLSQGEYVAAEMVEAAYGKSPMVSQIWIYGNSYKSFVVGVVVPNSERFIEIGRSKGWYTGPGFTADGYPEAFAKLWDEHLPELKHELIASLRDFEADLKGFEKARDFIVEFNVNNMGLGFTEENEMLTPTFKLRRANLLKTYMAKLRDTYKANGEPPSADEIWSG
ncbi:hypothetical protein PBRA_005797 [Plasmodiophora brassicae]|uniref:AMP-dependent synthetase/ligase domain-containing protein n=1 Tax=Plasmodiophora brassicae TaxID=37360 RepID=A0A0G4IQR0_PLABS|nr:hypothetical protein PBRA_005797 [Plasmodiophora brassicae]